VLIKDSLIVHIPSKGWWNQYQFLAE